MDRNFDSLATRLENKIYGTEKGIIRFELLKEDILEFCTGFRTGKWRILDAGGGTGRFSRFCASFGHQVVLCDISTEMLKTAQLENRKRGMHKQINLIQRDITAISSSEFGKFDLVLLHGVAEWMEDPASAIRHCSGLVRENGFFSLLVYNTNKYLLKRGLNGRLLTQDKKRGNQRKLTPTGRMTPQEAGNILKEKNGEILIRSGIRVFNNFLKTIEPLAISTEEWLEQERLYYRKEPFASLGEHSHLIWKNTN